MAGVTTPTQALLLLAAVAAFYFLGRLTRRDARAASVVRGRRVRRALAGLRLRRPTRREAHVAWLVVSLVVAFALTRAVALPLFLLVFFALWLSGFGVLARLYR